MTPRRKPKRGKVALPSEVPEVVASAPSSSSKAASDTAAQTNAAADTGDLPEALRKMLEAAYT